MSNNDLQPEIRGETVPFVRPDVALTELNETIEAINATEDSDNGQQAA